MALFYVGYAYALTVNNEHSLSVFLHAASFPDVYVNSSEMLDVIHIVYFFS